MTMVTDRLEPMLDKRDVRLAKERDAEIDVLEQRMKAYADQQDREWYNKYQERLEEMVEQLDDILERLSKIAETTTSAISSHENRTRDQIRSFENRIVAVENSASSRDRQIQALENNSDDLIRLTAENAAAARANATSIKYLRRDMEKYDEKLEETVKRNNELHNKIDNVQGKVDDVHDDMREQRAHRERWQRRSRRLLDFLSSKTGKRLLTAGAGALTILAGHFERVWERVFDLFGF